MHDNQAVLGSPVTTSVIIGKGMHNEQAAVFGEDTRALLTAHGEP